MSGANARNLARWIDDTPGLTTNLLRARARRLKAEIPNLAFIMVDYLQLMHHSFERRSSESRQAEVAEISRSMKMLAGELDIPVLALAQVNRNPEQRRGPNQRPILSDLRESGAIEQDADVVMFVHRDPKLRAGGDGQSGGEPEGGARPGDTAEIILAKQRNGETGTIYTVFFGQWTLFQSMPKNFWPR